MLLSDKQIKLLAEQGMITPFIPTLVRQVQVHNHPDTAPIVRKVVSYGLSSYGYDLRLSPKTFKVFRRIPGQIVDPKNFDPETLIDAPLLSDRNGDYFILPAHTYGLGVALERLEIPNNITCLFIGKSTYARAGTLCNLTPGESGWFGHLTLEIGNSSDADCRIYANEGIAQALFFEGMECETTYRDRAGKYQGQPEQVVFSRV